MKDIECPSELYVIDPVCPWKDADATRLSRKNHRRVGKMTESVTLEIRSCLICCAASINRLSDNSRLEGICM
jgi:hypothetical protein